MKILEAVLYRNIRNSEIAVAKEKRVFLTYDIAGLAHCELQEEEDSVNFAFNTQGFELAETIFHKTKWEQFRFLANCAQLSNLSVEYDYSMALDNLIIDINLIPKLLIRDAKKNDGLDFVQRYKALVGSVLLHKYKYEDYLNGGQDLYKKNKLLFTISEMETADEIKNSLLDEYQRMIHEVGETKKLVPKKTVLTSRIAIPVLAVLFAVTAFLSGRMLFIDIPFRNDVITANTAYINGNFLGVQQALNGYDLSRLSVETRFFLSRSYVATEALTDAQRANILIGLAQRTEPIIFDYWILLGRLYFSEAVDIARRLGDDELLLFAYLKQDVFVRQDISMPGEERAQLLSYLETNIDRLNRARDEATGSN